MEGLTGATCDEAGHSNLSLTGVDVSAHGTLHRVLVLMFTVFTGVLMVMVPSVGAMVVSMCMLVLMFVVVSLSRSVHVFMTVEMLMRMGTFHGWCSFQTDVFNDTTLS